MPLDSEGWRDTKHLSTHVTPAFSRPSQTETPYGIPSMTSSRHPASLQELHFDTKLKTDLVPTWDGNTNTLITWILSVNQLGGRSSIAYIQLGQIVPTKLRGFAQEWYYSLSRERREMISQDWGTLRVAIKGYFMDRKWQLEQESQAHSARYRDRGHERETPTEYFIRKKRLLSWTSSGDSDAQMIAQIMKGTPPHWRSHLNTFFIRTVEDLGNQIKYHEDSLLGDPSTRMDMRNLESKLDTLLQRQGRSQDWRDRRPNNSSFSRRDKGHGRRATTHLVGWSPSLEKPQWPRDDTVVSKGKTPEDKGARPCRHCGSPKHWDNECRHSKKGAKRAKTNYSEPNLEDTQAQEAYNALYQEEEDSEYEDPNWEDEPKHDSSASSASGSESDESDSLN